MEISWNMRKRCEFDITYLRGEPALDGHLIRINLKYHILALKGGTTFSNPWATISLDRDNIHIGRALGPSALHLTQQENPYDNNCELTLLLSKEAMEALEKERDGGDLKLKFNLQGEITEGDTKYPTGVTVPWTISRGDWTRVRQEAKCGVSILFEVPLSIELQDPAGKVDAALASARKHLYDGNYSDVVGACRRIIKSIMPDRTTIDRIRTANKEGREDLTKKDREAGLIIALNDYANLPHHEDQDYTRQEAILVLGVALGLVSNQIEKVST